MANHKGSEGYVKVGSNTVAEVRDWSLTATSQKVKAPFTMRNMLKKTSVPVLIIHHKKDGCIVTPFAPVKSLSKKKGFSLAAISGGGSTGNPCGPLHYHGFEGTMSQVITEIKRWAETL